MNERNSMDEQNTDLLILSARPIFWEQHLPALRAQGLGVLQSDSYEQTEAVARQGQLRLVLVDLPHNFESLGNSVRRVQAMRPGLLVAVTSDLTRKDLKEALDGLSVFLTLPQHPGDLDIKLLLSKLAQRA